METFELLKQEASAILPKSFENLGDLIAIDGSLIDSVLSMDWADYRTNSKKAKAHVGFNLNTGTPHKVFVTNGNAGERPFVGQILQKGETSVTDRGYQCHRSFDQFQNEEKFFICRIKENTNKTILKQNETENDSLIFFDSIVTLGCTASVQTQQELRLVAYTIDETDYWIATNRFDLSAEQIAEAYKLRWEIESFFGWWKRHLSVYHILARSEYGLKVQIFAGLITYLLIAIYCYQEHGEKVSIKRVRELRYKIINEARQCKTVSKTIRAKKRKIKNRHRQYAKT